jgi:hypothetical protein
VGPAATRLRAAGWIRTAYRALQASIRMNLVLAVVFHVLLVVFVYRVVQTDLEVEFVPLVVIHHWVQVAILHALYVHQDRLLTRLHRRILNLVCLALRDHSAFQDAHLPKALHFVRLVVTPCQEVEQLLHAHPVLQVPFA